jgi:hypothetical protein
MESEKLSCVRAATTILQAVQIVKRKKENFFFEFIGRDTRSRDQVLEMDISSNIHPFVKDLQNL